MGKVIIIARVSTEVQSLEQQYNELFNKALSLGYSEEDIISIKNEESAIKLAEEERETLDKMKKNIEGHTNIDRVIFWDISRMARRGDVATSICEYLRQHKVQLNFLSPFPLELFEIDEYDSSFVPNVMAYQMFLSGVAYATSEMYIKKGRFRLGKVRNSRNGKYNGGNMIPFGYKVNKETNKFIIDEDNANIVRTIFSLYTDKQMSIHHIHDHLASVGIKMSVTTIKDILQNEAYTGVECTPRRSKYPRKYDDAIISVETYKKAREQANKNRVSTKTTKTNSAFLAQRILKCWDCGNYMSPKPKNCLFYCHVHTYPYSVESKHCDNCCTVRADVIDSLLWQLTKDMHIKNLITKSSLNVENLSFLEKELIAKLQVAPDAYTSLEDESNRIDNIYRRGKMSDKEYDNWYDVEYVNKKTAIDDNIKSLKSTLRAIRKQINQAKSGNVISYESVREIIDSVDEITEMDKKKELVHTYIKCVRAKYLRPGSKDKVFEVEYMNGIKEYYINLGFKTEVHRIILFANNRYALIDDAVGFKFEYEEMHMTQAHYLSCKEK